MENDISNQEIIEGFKEKLKSSPLLDIKPDADKSLQLITASPTSFFSSFYLNKDFTFVSFFSNELISSDGMVEISGQKIARKERYQLSEIDKFIPHASLSDSLITSTSLPYNQEQVLLRFLDKDDVFLSFGNVYYQRKGKKDILTSPLVFFKMKVKEEQGEYYLSLDYNSPLYNQPLFWILKNDYGIDFEFTVEGFNVNTLVSQAREKLRPLSFEADEGLFLFQAPVIEEIRLASLVNYESSAAADPVFMSFENPKDDKSLTTYASRKEHPLFIQHGLDQLAKNSLVKIDKNNKMNEDFLKVAVDETILHNGSVLYLYENEEEEKEGKRDLIKRYYDMFMPFKDLTKPGCFISDILTAVKTHPYYAIDGTLVRRQEEMKKNVDQLIDDDASLKAIGLPTNESSERIYLNFVNALAKATRTYDFSQITSYDFDDAVNDRDFLTFLSTSYYFTTFPFTRHPFYGLNSDVNKEQYQEVEDFLGTFKKDILDFEKIIADSEVKTSGWSDFNSIRDFDEAVKLFQIYSRYDGFPLEYFDIDQTPELINDIRDLEECYRNEASIRLSLDVLCRPAIWSKDFGKIVADVKDREKEKELKKEMKDIVKLTPYRSSFKTLIIFLDKYQTNHQKLAELRLKLEGVFGKPADSLDGLLNIDAAFDFVQSYKRHMKLFDKYRFDNPFTEKIFHDASFSEKYRSVYFSALMEQRSVIEHDLDKFRFYFNEDKYDYVQNSFDKVIERLNIRISTDESKFDEYLDFSKRADHASGQLRSALNIMEAEETPLFNFIADYTASLYQSLLLLTIHQKKGLQLMQNISKDEFMLYDQLYSYGDVLNLLDIIKSFEDLRMQAITKPNFTKAIGELKKTYHSQTLLSPSTALKRYGDVFFALFPLLASSFGEGTYLLEEKFDLVVLDFRKNHSLFDLFSAFKMAKKVIVLGSDFECSERIPPIQLDFHEDLKSFMGLNEFPSSFKRNVIRAMKRQNVVLKENVDIAPGITIPFYFEKGSQKFALRFFYKEFEMHNTAAYQIPAFLYLLFGIKTVNLYVLPYLVYQDLTVLSLFGDLDEAMVRLKDKENDFSALPEDQKKMKMYFKTLDDITSTFPSYLSDKTSEVGTLRSSSLDIRPLSTISPKEIAYGIQTYLNRFSYLSRDTLLREIGRVIGTDEKDVDFRLLFQKAESLLIDEGVIKKDQGRLSLIRN